MGTKVTKDVTQKEGKTRKEIEEDEWEEKDRQKDLVIRRRYWKHLRKKKKNKSISA
jgi:hypothetical protein